MKKIYLIFAAISLLMLSCENKGKSTDQEATEKADSSTNETLRSESTVNSNQGEVLDLTLEDLEGEWVWVGEGENVEEEKPSDIELTLTMGYDEEENFCVEECMIYGSTAVLDLDYLLKDGYLHLFDKEDKVENASEFEAELSKTPNGDLTGFFVCTIGDSTDTGNLTLTKKIPQME